MKQMTFADAEYASKRKQIRKELAVPDRDGSGHALEGVGSADRAHYPKGEGGRPTR